MLVIDQKTDDEFFDKMNTFICSFKAIGDVKQITLLNVRASDILHTMNMHGLRGSYVGSLFTFTKWD